MRRGNILIACGVSLSAAIGAMVLFLPRQPEPDRPPTTAFVTYTNHPSVTGQVAMFTLINPNRETVHCSVDVETENAQGVWENSMQRTGRGELRLAYNVPPGEHELFVPAEDGRWPWRVRLTCTVPLAWPGLRNRLFVISTA